MYLLTMLAELFYCLQGLKCVDTFPLFIQPNAHHKSHRLLSHSFPATENQLGIYWVAFPLFLAQFYQWANVTRFTMTFSLVGIQTPFNPKKSWWVGLWSM